MAQTRYALGAHSATCVQTISQTCGVLNNKARVVITEALVCWPSSLGEAEVVRWGGNAQVRLLTPETHAQGQVWRWENSLH